MIILGGRGIPLFISLGLFILTFFLSLSFDSIYQNSDDVSLKFLRPISIFKVLTKFEQPRDEKYVLTRRSSLFWFLFPGLGDLQSPSLPTVNYGPSEVPWRNSKNWDILLLPDLDGEFMYISVFISKRKHTTHFLYQLKLSQFLPTSSSSKVGTLFTSPWNSTANLIQKVEYPFGKLRLLMNIRNTWGLFTFEGNPNEVNSIYISSSNTRKNGVSDIDHNNFTEFNYASRLVERKVFHLKRDNTSSSSTSSCEPHVTAIDLSLNGSCLFYSRRANSFSKSTNHAYTFDDTTSAGVFVTCQQQTSDDTLQRDNTLNKEHADISILGNQSKDQNFTVLHPLVEDHVDDDVDDDLEEQTLSLTHASLYGSNSGVRANEGLLFLMKSKTIVEAGRLSTTLGLDVLDLSNRRLLRSLKKRGLLRSTEFSPRRQICRSINDSSVLLCHPYDNKILIVNQYATGRNKQQEAFKNDEGGGDIGYKFYLFDYQKAIRLLLNQKAPELYGYSTSGILDLDNEFEIFLNFKGDKLAMVMTSKSLPPHTNSHRRGSNRNAFSLILFLENVASEHYSKNQQENDPNWQLMSEVILLPTTTNLMNGHGYNRGYYSRLFHIDDAAGSIEGNRRDSDDNFNTVVASQFFTRKPVKFPDEGGEYLLTVHKDGSISCYRISIGISHDGEDIITGIAVTFTKFISQKWKILLAIFVVVFVYLLNEYNIRRRLRIGGEAAAMAQQQQQQQQQQQGS